MSAGPPRPADLWDRLPPEVRGLLLALRADVAELPDKVPGQQQQIRALPERPNQNSTNSSRPPSPDPPTVKPRPPRPASGRSSGGQPGPPRQQRPLPPPDHTGPSSLPRAAAAG